jgi:hypothetical protein
MEVTNAEIAPKPTLVDLRERFKELDPPKIIRVESALVAANLWGEMLEQTEKSGYERGIVVFKKGQEIKTSKIFEGRMTEDNPGSIGIPLLVHGIRRPLLARAKDITFVHTHAASPNWDHLKTSRISPDDINVFATMPYNAVVAIDRGGAHLLAKRDKHVNKDVDGERIEEIALDAVKKLGNFSADLYRQRIARQLHADGYFYFYTSNLKPSPDGFVDMQRLYPAF